MKKINVAKLLKDCPTGMELDCTMFNDVKLSRVGTGTYPIVILTDGWEEILTTHGHWDTRNTSKCVIFPKGKTTWEGFQRPFKDGDIVASSDGWIAITTGGKIGEFIPTYCVLDINDEFKAYIDIKETWKFDRLATGKEKKKLFDAIKASGHRWNPETKTLDKLVETQFAELQFKVGDRVKHKSHNRLARTVTEVKDSYYILDSKLKLPFTLQDKYELVPNKFDIETLKPFDKVLIRDNNRQKWFVSFFSNYDGTTPYKHCCINGVKYAQCIPYKGNEHLLGKTEDCDNFYKTWE